MCSRVTPVYLVAGTDPHLFMLTVCYGINASTPEFLFGSRYNAAGLFIKEIQSPPSANPYIKIIIAYKGDIIIHQKIRILIAGTKSAQLGFIIAGQAIRRTNPKVTFPVLMKIKNLIGGKLVEEWKRPGEHVLCIGRQYSQKQK